MGHLDGLLTVGYAAGGKHPQSVEVDLPRSSFSRAWDQAGALKADSSSESKNRRWNA